MQKPIFRKMGFWNGTSDCRCRQVFRFHGFISRWPVNKLKTIPCGRRRLPKRRKSLIMPLLTVLSWKKIYADLWLVNNRYNKESIFALNFADGLGDNQCGAEWRPTSIGSESGWGFFYTKQSYIDKFDDKDKRKAATFLTEIVSTVDNKTYTTENFGSPYPHGKNGVMEVVKISHSVTSVRICTFLSSVMPMSC